MLGHGVKFGRKKEEAIAALLTHRNTEEAARAIGVAPLRNSAFGEPMLPLTGLECGPRARQSRLRITLLAESSVTC
jgi:hypothetical protein